MKDTRHKNVQWNLGDREGRSTWDQVIGALLMDIRDELQRINNVLHCSNFLEIPHKLDSIKRNTAKKRNVKRK
jgi:hypothetical protein